MLAYSQLPAEINPLAIDTITIIATHVVMPFHRVRLILYNAELSRPL
jgi:hypothetical protein